MCGNEGYLVLVCIARCISFSFPYFFHFFSYCFFFPVLGFPIELSIPDDLDDVMTHAILTISD